MRDHLTDQTATSAQLKTDIDSGLTGDKVSGFDPAAAPLGTDEEAAGTPPSPQMIAKARVAERSGTPARNAPAPVSRANVGPAPDGQVRAKRLALLGAAAIGATAGLLIGAVYFVLGLYR